LPCLANDPRIALQDTFENLIQAPGTSGVAERRPALRARGSIEHQGHKEAAVLHDHGRQEGKMSHKFAIGERVAFAGMPSQVRPTVLFEVTRHLPPDSRGEPQYRIKAPGESYERLVRESQIEKK
jgi:hypothetical protein